MPSSLCLNHPNKQAHARNLCGACYQRWYREHIPGAAEAHRQSNKRWLQDNPDKRASLVRRSRYKLSDEEYAQLLQQQQSCCGICREQKPLSIDHCHKTMKVRGLLCRTCNLALGLYERLRELGDVEAYLAHTTSHNAFMNRPSGGWCRSTKSVGRASVTNI